MMIVIIVTLTVSISMKYLISFSMYLCAFGAGTQIAAHNYKLAVFNIVGILFFYYVRDLYKKNGRF